MNEIWRSRAVAEEAAEKLRVFGQPQRLMILSLLLAGERSVTEIDEATAIGQPALSQQLAELRRAGMVSTRRQAKQVYYSLADPSVDLCVRSIEAVFGAGDPAAALRGVVQGEPQPPSPPPAGAAHFARVLE